MVIAGGANPPRRPLLPPRWQNAGTGRGRVVDELHRREQYFFDAATLGRLADAVAGFASPCCLCCPMLGRTLAGRGVPVTILDVDERFADAPGFERYDVYRPHWLARRFGLIICDPPFFTVSLSQLFTALRQLSHNDFTQPLLVSYLSRRANAILGTFAPFGLAATGYFPGYLTVRPTEKNRIEFFGNVAGGVRGLGEPGA